MLTTFLSWSSADSTWESSGHHAVSAAPLQIEELPKVVAKRLFAVSLERIAKAITPDGIGLRAPKSTGTHVTSRQLRISPLRSSFITA
jgi:hypothetical protein